MNDKGWAARLMAENGNDRERAMASVSERLSGDPERHEWVKELIRTGCFGPYGSELCMCSHAGHE